MHKAHVKADIEVDIEMLRDLVHATGGRVSIARLEAMPLKAALQFLYPNGIRFRFTHNHEDAIDGKTQDIPSE